MKVVVDEIPTETWECCFCYEEAVKGVWTHRCMFLPGGICILSFDEEINEYSCPFLTTIKR